MTDKYSSLQQLCAAPQNVSSSLSNTHWECPTSSSWRMEKQAWWHQQVGTMGCRFHRKDSLLDSAGPCSLSQAVGPVVTQEGMPATSRGHARELLSTCQQVTSYDNQMRATLRAICVTAYVDLGLSFQGLSFTFSWAHSQGPSCGAPPLLASAESRSSKSQSLAVPSGWCRALPGSAVSRTSHSSFQLAPLLHTSWFLPVGQRCGWRSVLFLLGHLIVFPGIVMAFGCTSLMIEICWLTTADITKFCWVLAVGIGKVLTASSIWAVWGPLQGQRSLEFLRHLTPGSGLSPADITRAKSLMDLTSHPCGSEMLSVFLHEFATAWPAQSGVPSSQRPETDDLAGPPTSSGCLQVCQRFLKAMSFLKFTYSRWCWTWSVQTAIPWLRGKSCSTILYKFSQWRKYLLQTLSKKKTVPMRLGFQIPPAVAPVLSERELWSHQENVVVTNVPRWEIASLSNSCIRDT